VYRRHRVYTLRADDTNQLYKRAGGRKYFMRGAAIIIKALYNLISICSWLFRLLCASLNSFGCYLRRAPVCTMHFRWKILRMGLFLREIVCYDVLLRFNRIKKRGRTTSIFVTIRSYLIWLFVVRKDTILL
jgi:hypothetical protein